MVDILIVGAGPTGLMAACECLRFGLTVLLIDKSPTPSIHSKALVIQARTLEIFDQIGIVDDFLNQGLKVEQFKGFSNQKQILKIDFSSIDSPYPFALSIEQNQTEALLTKHLHTLGGSIQREVELISLEQTKTCVIAKLYDLQKKRDS